MPTCFRNNFIKIASTFFYVGYLPAVPGTYGSLTALGLFYLTRSYISTYVLTAIVLAIGFLVSGRAERIYQKKDADYIVIDEVAGMLISVLFLPHNLFFIVSAFLIFRLLDILKPYPASSLQESPGSLGVMMDDVVAGLYTNIVLQIVFRFTFFSGS